MICYLLFTFIYYYFRLFQTDVVLYFLFVFLLELVVVLEFLFVILLELVVVLRIQDDNFLLYLF